MAQKSPSAYPLARYDPNAPNVVSARLRKAAPNVKKVSKLSKLLPLLKSLGKGSIPTAVAFTVLPMIADRLMRGSDETQMRNQMNLQKKLEMEQMGEMAQMAGGPSMGAGMQMGMRPQRQPTMTDLMASQDMIERASRLGQQDNMLQESLARPSGKDELESLLVGDEVRLRQLQSPRRISPYEIMSILNGA